MRVCDLERLVLPAGLCEIDGRKYDVVWVVRIELKGLLRVTVGLCKLAFRIPVDSQIPIRQSCRINLDRSFHQRQTLSEIAVMDRHLPEAMQGYRGRQRIALHF